MYSTDIGGISWVDLTVSNAQEVRDFYSDVIDLEAEPLSMGDYDDYVMKSPHNEELQVGVCHARGVNAGLPPQWLVYFNVEDIEASVEACTKRGGKVIAPVREMDDFSMCVIQDPAGAVAALIAKK